MSLNLSKAEQLLSAIQKGIIKHGPDASISLKDLEVVIEGIILEHNNTTIEDDFQWMWEIESNRIRQQQPDKRFISWLEQEFPVYPDKSKD